MSRIEIGLDEYNGLKEKIRTLENTIYNASKEMTEYKEKLNELEPLIMDLENEGLLNRIFSWKSVIDPLISVFKHANKG